MSRAAQATRVARLTRPGRRNRLGFTLVETAVALTALGLVGALLLPPLVAGIKREKVALDRSRLASLRAEIIGWCQIKGRPPESLAPFIHATDGRGGAVRYTVAPALLKEDARLCDPRLVDAGLSLVEGGERVGNLAFAVYADGEDRRPEIALEDEALVKPEGADDPLEAVSLYELKARLDCGRRP